MEERCVIICLVMLCFEHSLWSSSTCGGTIRKSSRGPDIRIAQWLPGHRGDSPDMERSMNTNRNTHARAHTHGSSVLCVRLLPYLRAVNVPFLLERLANVILICMCSTCANKAKWLINVHGCLLALLHLHPCPRAEGFLRVRIFSLWLFPSNESSPKYN